MQTAKQKYCFNMKVLVPLLVLMGMDASAEPTPSPEPSVTTSPSPESSPGGDPSEHECPSVTYTHSKFGWFNQQGQISNFFYGGVEPSQATETTNCDVF